MLSSEGQFATVTGKFTDIKIKNSDAAIEAAKEVSQSIGIPVKIISAGFFGFINYLLGKFLIFRKPKDKEELSS